MTPLHTFTLINLIGGTAVLTSYVVVLALYPDLRSDFWGQINGGLRIIFTGSMLLAGAGYLLFLYWTVFTIGDNTSNSQWLVESHWPGVLVGMFLTFSTIWMPLTAALLKTGNESLWISIVVILWVVAISLWALFILVIIHYWNDASWTSFLATAGLFYIALHCTILDAIVWVNRFPRTSP